MEWVPVVFIVFKVAVLGTGMFFAIKWHYDKDRKKNRDAIAALRKSQGNATPAAQDNQAR